ncbi:hypothetical protein, variant [Cryptococcus amylolentus CBS 6039]|uniref:FCP1 homology domain-containing protein n=2 Tax=Cryptococcus amylolentus TaxID=104669 RepID=A0A1E3H9Z1_9TREE|nr:hypothetical protein, variant [Cryptococcus amylolentus CBS 6039]ODN73172.1 hypothetical protein, variant [Cryptococcus amylolentus CBS 6039]ODN98998.1 hypothetical protein I350_07150 [Cryptococcus amylolentus CBS 6273]
MASLAPPIPTQPAVTDERTVLPSSNGADTQSDSPKSPFDSTSSPASASPQPPQETSPTTATAADKSAGMPESESKGPAPKTAAQTTPAPAAEASASSSKPSPSAPAPATTSTATPSSSTKPAPPASKQPPTTAGQKKKRKRKGIAGLLLSFGCLSAEDFEDEPSKAPAASSSSVAAAAGGGPKKTAAAEAAGQKAKADATSGGSKPVANGAPDVNKKDVAPTPGKGETGATLAGDGKDKQVIVPPTEPHTLPEDETAGLTSSAVQPPGSGSSLLLGTPSRQVSHRESNPDLATNTAEQTTTSGGYSDISNTDVVDDTTGTGEREDDVGGEEYLDYDDEEDRLIEQGGMGIPTDENGTPCPLLPPLAAKHRGRKCLVLDLDETLLHSSFKQLPAADYIVPVEIESQVHNVYVIKRPGVDRFLTEMARYYEIVVFTASLSKYADPVLDMLDPHGVVSHRLFRESCYNHKGNYVKDLSQLGRDIHTSIIIDNSPASYIFHPNNAVPVSTWFSDPHDSELTDLVPFLADLSGVEDVRGVLDGRV